MADALDQRNPFVDLTVVTARTIRPAGSGRVRAIRINGTAGGGESNIVLRERVATTGEVIFTLLAPSTSTHDGTISFPGSGRVFDGIFMDVLTTAWAAGSHMIVYTGEAVP